MKKLSLCLVLFTLFGCSPNHMIKLETCPDIKKFAPPAGKAALFVAHKGAFFGGAVNIEYYLDKQFIGSTKGSSSFHTIVNPGEHYIINRKLIDTGYVNFEPNKLYFYYSDTASYTYDIVDSERFIDGTDGISCYKKDMTSVRALSDEDYQTAKQCKNRIDMCTR